MRVAKSRAKSSSWVETTSVRLLALAGPAAASRARCGARDRAMRSARPATAAADPPPAPRETRDPLRLAPRQLPRQRPGAVIDAEPAQQLEPAAAGAIRRDAVRVHRREADVLDRDRCSNRQWNWKTIPTLRRSARSVAAGMSVPPVNVTPSTSIRPD